MTIQNRPKQKSANKSAMLNIEAATTALQVSRNTLYAYVSRGHVRSIAHPTLPKASLYVAADIQALIDRKTRLRRPRMAAATALDFGLPVLKTKLTHFEGDHLFYRNKNAIELSRTATLEEAARLMWNTERSDPFDKLFFRGNDIPGWRETSDRFSDARSPDRASALLPLLTTQTNPYSGLSGPQAFLSAARLLLAVTSACIQKHDTIRAPLHKVIAGALSKPKAADVVRRALVLLADHELNASTFAVRVVASTGARHTNCVLGGLAALSGPRHGAASERARSFLNMIARPEEAENIIGDRLEHGELLPGFGHFVYRSADPRAAELLNHLKLDPIAKATLDAARSLGGIEPNIDFALVAMERSLNLPEGTAISLFSIARTVGWLAHVFEQRAAGNLIRPRAEFVLE